MNWSNAQAKDRMRRSEQETTCDVDDDVDERTKSIFFFLFFLIFVADDAKSLRGSSLNAIGQSATNTLCEIVVAPLSCSSCHAIIVDWFHLFHTRSFIDFSLSPFDCGDSHFIYQFLSSFAILSIAYCQFIHHVSTLEQH